MALVLDTSVLIEIEKKNPSVITQLSVLSKDHPEPPAITFPTYCEYYLGYLDQRPESQAKALKDLEYYPTLHTTNRNARLFARLRHTLGSRGKPLSTFDSLIASIALEHNLPLATLDQAFTDVPGLRVILLH